MNKAARSAIRQFVAACHRAAEMGLVRCSSGNLSWRAGRDLMLIKGSRSWMGEMTESDVALCRISDGSSLNNKMPSVEIGFHAGILRARQDVNVVFHFQATFATVLACRKGKFPNVMVIPEIPFYIGVPAVIPYYPPGSKELADAVTEAMKKHDIVIMRNHGQVTVSADIRHALQNAVFLELACEIVARNGRGHYAILPSHEISRLCKFSMQSGARV